MRFNKTLFLLAIMLLMASVAVGQKDKDKSLGGIKGKFGWKQALRGASRLWCDVERLRSRVRRLIRTASLLFPACNLEFMD